MIRPIHILPLVFLVFLAGAVVVIKAHRAPLIVEAAAIEAAPAQTTRERWARDVLSALGNDHPSAATVAFLVTWTIAEDGSDGALSRNNLLNTTQCGHNQTSAINGDGACGVAGYATYQDGIDATIDTMTQANFSAIAAALQANDPAAARAALFASPWAESHYGYGASWPGDLD